MTLASRPSTSSRAIRRFTPAKFAAIGIAFLLSGALISVAEWMAARGDATLHYYVFWVAYFLVFAPVVWTLVSRATSSSVRGSLIVALGVWSMVPKLVRTGANPLYYDEFAHFRMLEDMVRTGHPVSSTGLLQIGANFPGLELVTNAVYHLSGLSLWTCAVVVASVAHVTLLVGMYTLVKDATRSSRAGAIAAVVYSLNPSWFFFDAQFSYETLALPMLVWGLVFGMRAIHRREPGTPLGSQPLEISIAVIISAALVITHHMTSVVICCVLVGIAVVVELQHRKVLKLDFKGNHLIAWALATWAVALTATRFVTIGHPLVVYLGPVLHINKQFAQLLSFLGIGSALPLRGAFAGSTVPFFEILCAYLMLPILLVAFLWATWGILGRFRQLTPLHLVSVILGALFFVSLPLVSTVAFSESVHRSWAFSFVGLAFVVGTAASWALDGSLAIRLRARELWPLPVAGRRWARAAAAASLVVVAIGGVSIGTSVAYRFGGKVTPGEDVTYLGTQTSMVANWFRENGKASDVVFADRFVSRPIAVDSSVHIIKSGDGPWKNIILAPVVSRRTLENFLHGHITYIVFDRRLGEPGLSKAWRWYTLYEASVPASSRKHAYTARMLCLDWTNAVFATTDYEVLEVNDSHLTRDLADRTDGLIPGCLVRGVT